MNEDLSESSFASSAASKAPKRTPLSVIRHINATIKQSRLYQFLFPQKLGLIPGVVIPSTLNIFGVILFLRMSQIVGTVGFIWAMIFLVFSYGMNVFTILSLSAMATNGEMKGGGAYYIVSRSLGSEFGVSTAVMLCVANGLAGVLEGMGFCEALLINFPQLAFGTPYITTVVYNSILLLLLIIIGMAGAGLFSKLGYLYVTLIAASIVTIFVSLIAQKPGAAQNAYTGFSFDTFKTNLTPHWSGSFYNAVELSAALGVFYPACSGFMAGFNISQDLRSPERDMPRGSLIACVITCSTYVVFIILTCFTVKQDSLVEKTSIMRELSLFVPLQVIGILTSTFCAAFMSYISCSRILCSLARDRLVPLIGPLGKGFGKNQEPLLALIFTWFCAQCVIFVGRIDFVAPFVSLAFILVYFLNNLACLVTFLTWVPNFRPRFRFFSWWSALTGMVMSAAALFIINPLYAAIELILVAFILFAVWVYSPPKSFGNIGKSILFYQLRKYMLKMDSRNDSSHVKYWRFKPVVLSPNPRSSTSFERLSFFHSVSKHRGGLATFAKIDTRDFRKTYSEHEAESKAMYQLGVAACWRMYASRIYAGSLREGIRCLLTTGHTLMRPNTLVLGFHEDTPLKHYVPNTGTTRGRRVQQALSAFPPLPDRSDRSVDLHEFMEIIKDVLLLRRSLLLTRYFDKLGGISLAPPHLMHRLLHKKHRYIDVWIFVLNENEEGLEPTVSLTLQLAFLIKQSSEWKRFHKVRVLMVADYNSNLKLERKKVKDMLKMARINATVRVINVGPEDIAVLDRKSGANQDDEGSMHSSDTFTTSTQQLNGHHEHANGRPVSPDDLDMHFEGVAMTRVSSTFESSEDVTRHEEDSSERRTLQRSNTLPVTKREQKGLSLSKSISLEFVKKTISIDDYELQFSQSVQLLRPDGTPLTEKEKYTVLNHIIRSFSEERTSIVLLTLPPPPPRFDASAHREYHDCLKTLSDDLPTTIMVYGFEQTISIGL